MGLARALTSLSIGAALSVPMKTASPNTVRTDMADNAWVRRFPTSLARTCGSWASRLIAATEWVSP